MADDPRRAIKVIGARSFLTRIWSPPGRGLHSTRTSVEPRDRSSGDVRLVDARPVDIRLVVAVHDRVRLLDAALVTHAGGPLERSSTSRRSLWPVRRAPGATKTTSRSIRR